MKKILISIFAFALIMCCMPGVSRAIPAYPFPITVRQPDGSTITIQVHGDEFLHWTTCGGKLVAKGGDGFYHNATFTADGKISIGSTKAGAASFTGSSSVTPPAAAVQRALRMRQENYASNSNMKMAAENLQRVASGQPAKSISQGSKKFLVILVQYSDVSFTVSNPQSTFSNLLNQSGYSYNGATGSVKDYYKDNSNSQFVPTFDVAGPVTLTNTQAYYGGNDSDGNDLRARQMVAEACNLLDSSVDFSQYDNDGDGYVDNVYCYYAGYNEAEGGGDNTIWPHSWSLGTYAVTLDGVTVSHYACGSEFKGASGATIAGIGTFSHEFGHVLGLPDFYDVDYANSGGQAFGLQYFSLMSSGNYLNNGNTPPCLTAIERNMLGWMSFTQLTTSGDYTLEPVQNNKAYTSATKTNGEYYVYENRQKTGWDTYLYGHGMLIYHVDQSSNIVGTVTAASRWNSNTINAYPSHQCCDLVEAIPESQLTISSISSMGKMPFPGTEGITSFTSATSPAAKDWAGNATGYNLTSIAETGSNITFTLSVGAVTNLALKGYNAIADLKKSYSAGEAFTLALMPCSNTPSSVAWYFDGASKNAGDAITLTSGNHVVKAELTFANGSKETLIQEI